MTETQDLVDVEKLRALQQEIELRPLMGPFADSLQREIRLAFNTAIGNMMDGDGGYVIHTKGHAENLIAACTAILSMSTELSTLRAQCEAQRKALEAISHNSDDAASRVVARRGLAAGSANENFL